MAGYLGHNPVRKNYAVDEFTISAAQASSGNFTLSQTVADSKFLEVSVGGIDQPQSAYTVSGTTLAFGANIVAENDIVIVRHAGESLMYPSLEDGAVTDGKIAGMAATKLTGTLPDARFPATLPAASGVNLTALNASNLGSGTVPTARLGSGASSSKFLRGDSTYAEAGGGLHTQIGSTSDFTNVSEVEFTSGITGYKTYILIGEEIISPTVDVQVKLQIGESGGYKSDGNYGYHLQYSQSNNNTYNAHYSTGATETRLVNFVDSHAQSSWNFILRMHWMSGRRWSCVWDGVHYDGSSGNSDNLRGVSNYMQALTFSKFRLFTSGGSGHGITGRLRLFGI